MGGGGAMRAAAKVAGIGVVNSGLRGVPAEHPISAAARKATRPVSAVVSSSEDVKSNVLIASQNDKIDASVQRPCWEIDDWEFAGGEEDLFMESREQMPRLVFGGAPTLQEAKEATSELKDALEKVYLSSPKSTGGGGSLIAGQESGLSLLPNSEYLETKACVASETTGSHAVPKNALQAFRFLNESPAAQTVVASIASDPNVWHAVLQNEALVEFLQLHKTSASFSDMDPIVNESAADAKFQDLQSPLSFHDSRPSQDFGDGFMGFLQKIKLAVVDMMSSLSDYFQNLFGGPATEKISADADGSARNTSMDRALGASFMGLAVMVIMVVVLKRG
uniref:Uncharacterized protein n=1 Tax=Davidia involucrata TaxID=16924 RepID=A0A5B6YW31_DAVIN